MTNASEEGKALAGREAAQAVLPGMKLGLGTGSTAAHFLEALGRRIREGELPGTVGVATSLGTEQAARDLGIPLTTLEEVGWLDLTVDGADEVDPGLNLIKGMGGALLREKMVAQATLRFVIIADEGKLVTRLGTRSPLPLEVIPFSWRSHLPFLRELGAEPSLRRGSDGEPVFTDNGNLLVDCRFPDGMQSPRALQSALMARAGIVETGLFLGMADEVVVGGRSGVRHLLREKAGNV